MTSTYEKIATTTLGTVSTGVTFSSISGSYTDLVLIISYRLDGAGTGAAGGLRFNSDSSTNYSATFMYGTGSSAISARASNATYADVAFMSSNSWATSITNIQNYSNTTTFKTLISRNSVSNGEVTAYVNIWRSTSAINNIQIFAGSNYAVGTMFTLYGIKAE
jgi:hypothetical protein